MDLEAISREAAEEIPGAKSFRGGGLRFHRRGFEARVDFMPGATDILFDTRDLAVEAIQLAPAGIWHDVKGAFGFKDVQVGDPEFDADFEIKSSHEEFARKVLQPEVRAVLKGLSRYAMFFWRLSRAGFLLRVRALPGFTHVLNRWLVAAFQLLDALPGADGRDRVQLGVARTTIDAEATCQICGAPLAAGALVRCAKCATPHHRDCWEFNGRCSTFACGESRFL